MIGPYAKPPTIPAVGIVRGDGRVVLDDGSIRKLADVEQIRGRLRLFADRDLVRVRFLHRGVGAAVCWNGLPVRWLPDPDHEIILLGSYPGDGPDLLDGIVTFRDFLARKGAAISSPGSSSWSLLRSTLTRPLLIDGAEDDDRPAIGEVIGGRQEAFVPPGHYGGFVHFDLTAAYASALGKLVYAGKWVRWRGMPADDSPWPALVRARVRLPRDVIGPLPRRNRAPSREALLRRLERREYPAGRVMTGTWTIEELRVAEEAGATVKVLDVWLCVGPGLRQPFLRWWKAIEQARKLDGYAGIMAKTAGNALWGRFVTFGDRTLVRWLDGHPIAEPYPIRVPPKEMQGLLLAETITGRVRARLYREMIAPHAERLISVHTDGGLLSVGEEGERPTMPQGWRPKEIGTDLTYINPQAFAFTKAGRRVYKIAGVRPDDAPGVFSELTRIVLGYPSNARAGAVDRDREALRRLREAFPEIVDPVPA